MLQIILFIKRWCLGLCTRCGGKYDTGVTTGILGETLYTCQRCANWYIGVDYGER